MLLIRNTEDECNLNIVCLFCNMNYSKDKMEKAGCGISLCEMWIHCECILYNSESYI